MFSLYRFLFSGIQLIHPSLICIFQIVQEQLKSVFRHMLHDHDMGKVAAEPVIVV